MLDEIAEKEEFLRRQSNFASVRVHQMLVDVDGHWTIAQHLRRAWRPRRTTEQSSDARDQLLRAERLRDVVVGPKLEPLHAVSLLAPRRQHDDRQVRHRRIAAERLADEQTIHAR